MTPKRFILFICPFYYPAGGMADAKGSYDSLEEAMMAMPPILTKEFWEEFESFHAQILDRETWQEWHFNGTIGEWTTGPDWPRPWQPKPALA